MKYLLLATCLMALNAGCDSQSKFIGISPVYDVMDLQMTSGVLFQRGHTETYFISAIEEDMPFFKGKEIKLKHDFIIVKIKRIAEDQKQPAYKMLDSMLMCKRALKRDTGIYSNWSAEEKAEIKHLTDIESRVTKRFYDQVMIYVEAEAINTGISNEAYLAMKPPKRPVPPVVYAREWKASDFGVIPDDGKEDHTGWQRAIDSAQALSGKTKFLLPAGGYYIPKGKMLEYFYGKGELIMCVQNDGLHLITSISDQNTVK